MTMRHGHTNHGHQKGVPSRRAFPAEFVRALIRDAQQRTAADTIPMLEWASQHISDLPDDSHGDALAGAVHAALADALIRDGREDAAAKPRAEARRRFAKVDHEMWQRMPDIATLYVTTLVHDGDRHAAAAFLSAAADVDLDESLYLEVASVHVAAGDLDGALRIVFACLTNGRDEGATLTMLGAILESPGGPEATRRMLSDRLGLMNGDIGKRLLDVVNTTLLQVDDVDLRAVRAALLYGQGEIDEAVAELRRVCVARPFDVSSSLTLARLHLRSGRPDAAASVLTSLSDTDDDESVVLLLAEAKGRRGNWQSALETAQSVRARFPNSKQAGQLIALALSQLNRVDEALDVLDRNLAADPEQPDAWRLKASIYLDQRDFDAASEALAGALKAGLDRPRASELYLRKAKLAIDDNKLARADDDLETSTKLAPPHASRLGLLSEILHGLGRDEEAIEAAERGLQSYPGRPDLLIAKATALRAQGRQSAALAIVLDLSARGHGATALWLHALLSCDSGDFLGALDLLGPATEPMNRADHGLLSLRGWVHQNLEGDEHAIAGERAYRAASQARSDDLWYRKGLANALRRMPDRFDEALALYRSIINEANMLQASDAVTPHLQCLTAWCHYQSGDPEAAADYYTMALTQKLVGAAAQFDYALTLLAGGHVEAALGAYRRTLSDIQNKDVLRRCGLIYVALVDVRAGYAPHGPLAKGSAPLAGVAAIKQLLREALRKAADEASSTFTRLADAMHAFALQDEATSEAGVPVLLWDQLTLVGCHRPNTEGECVLLPLVVAPLDHADTYYVLRNGAATQTVNARELDELTENGSLIRLAAGAGVTSDTRVVYVTSHFVTTCGIDLPRGENDGLDWQAIESPVSAFVAITPSARAADLVCAFVETATERAIAIARAGCSHPANRDFSDALEISMLAARSSPDEQLAYRALLAHGMAGGDLKAMTDSLKARLGDAWQLDAERAQTAVHDFCAMLQLQQQEEAAAIPPSPSRAGVSAYSENALVQQILDRALRIADIKDDDEQEREAIRAAAEVNAIVPVTESLDQIRSELSLRLQSQANFYLDNDASILLMACEPAFYSSSAVVPLTRPAVNSFAFVKAAARYGGGSVVLPLSSHRRVLR